MVSIGVEEPPAKATEFKRKYKLTHPVVSDPSRTVFGHFFLPLNYELPYLILIGRDGRITQVDCGLEDAPKAIARL